MVQAAQIISQTAPTVTEDEWSVFLNRSAFDMFSSTMFGELTKTVDPSLASPENIAFSQKTVDGFHKMTEIFFDPKELMASRLFGMETKKLKEMTESFTQVFDASHQKYLAFREKYDAGQLDELEQQSYLALAIARQSNSDITEDELSDVIKLMLSASIDTTSSLLGWNLYHVAANQEVQERLYQELASAVAKEESGGAITENVLRKSTCPYLHAIVRESHRLTPALPVPLQKENAFGDIELHGSLIPKDSLFFLDSYSTGVDPDVVDDPLVFQPERFLDDAVDARKGTPGEILDHPLYRDPFSHGSRKCPGARVANNEVLIFLSQLVLDWKISTPPEIQSFQDMEYTLSGVIQAKLPALTFAPRTREGRESSSQGRLLHNASMES
jgi:cytochrome P450